MTNLLTVLPDFDVHPFTHVLHSLEKARLSTADLLTIDPIDAAKRAQLPPVEVKKLVEAVTTALHKDLDRDIKHSEDGRFISVLDDALDAVLGGGIKTGHITEFVGESAAGKTQYLMTLLLAAQLHPPRGLGKGALYVSTEAPLQTTRLSQILKTNQVLSQLPAEEKPSLSRVQSTHLHDLEAQEHILRYQVPVAVQRHDLGLVIIDSIAANYRPEFGKSANGNAAISFAKRSDQLGKLGSLLHSMAAKYNVAIVVANQVADRFSLIDYPIESVHPTQNTQASRPETPTTQHPGTTHRPLISTEDPLALDHQQRFFSGWGDDRFGTNLKTPSLGLTWTNQLSTRIALLKEPIHENRAYAPGEEKSISGWRRTMKVVFSAWGAEGNVPFEIVGDGVRSVNEAN